MNKIYDQLTNSGENLEFQERRDYCTFQSFGEERVTICWRGEKALTGTVLPPIDFHFFLNQELASLSKYFCKYLYSSTMVNYLLIKC